jgi:hypothetical protein
MDMLRRLWYMVMGVLMTAGPVLAQKAHEPPKFQNRDHSTLVEWGIGAIFLVGCLVVAFKPSKRSNLH